MLSTPCHEEAVLVRSETARTYRKSWRQRADIIHDRRPQQTTNSYTVLGSRQWVSPLCLLYIQLNDANRPVSRAIPRLTSTETKEGRAWHSFQECPPQILQSCLWRVKRLWRSVRRASAGSRIQLLHTLLPLITNSGVSRISLFHSAGYAEKNYPTYSLTELLPVGAQNSFWLPGRSPLRGTSSFRKVCLASRRRDVQEHRRRETRDLTASSPSERHSQFNFDYFQCGDSAWLHQREQIPDRRHCGVRRSSPTGFSERWWQAIPARCCRKNAQADQWPLASLSQPLATSYVICYPIFRLANWLGLGQYSKHPHRARTGQQNLNRS